MTEERRKLKQKGWSLRAAAREIGISHQHLCAVLDGDRPSKITMEKARALPNRNSGKVSK